MCGIAGIYSYASSKCISTSVLEAMCRTFPHRGPDGSGEWVSTDGKVGFGHRRLAIVDLTENAAQPMANEDGSVRVTFNGEIYNHRTLRDELLSWGHVFRSDHSDTEVIVHGFEQWGIQGLLQRLDGDYAFAIWDGGERALYLARDPVGVKPLYYSVQEGMVVFASEIKAILASPCSTRAVDYEALYHYLTFLATPAPLTLFQGIKKIPAGCYASIRHGGALEITRHWDLFVDAEIEPDMYRDIGTVAGRLLEMLNTSIEKRMMSDVPIGVFLSGGVDSSTNLALMDKYSSEPVNTFTVGFEDDDENNEYAYAREVASLFAARHNELLVTQRDAMEAWDRIVYVQDEPLADWVCIPLHFIAELARSKGVSVVQVGEGSDEQFSGYPGYLRYLDIYRRLWQPYNKLPGFLKSSLSFVTNLMAGLSGRGKTYADLFCRAARGQELFIGGAVAFLETGKRELIDRHGLFAAGASGRRLCTPEVVAGLLQGFPSSGRGGDYLKKMIYLEFKQRLPELLLMRVDKMTMGSSVEARVPFLDKALVEYSMGIPSHYKILGCNPKYILKKAVEGVLPESIINRKKVGFSAPVSKWIRSEWGLEMEDEILRSHFVRSGVFSGKYIKFLFHAHRSLKADFSVQLWVLYNLVSWYRAWID